MNSNIYINKFDQNIFITENKKNYLHVLANKLKSEIVHHNNYIGGRYSVLSEVGMLPADLMGLKPDHFRQFNLLIKNKRFLNNLIQNVTATIFFLKNKKINSIILNYDEKAQNLFNWYQQLIAESLGKKGKGINPTLSFGPKDHHSLCYIRTRNRIRTYCPLVADFKIASFSHKVLEKSVLIRPGAIELALIFL